MAARMLEFMTDQIRGCNAGHSYFVRVVLFATLLSFACDATGQQNAVDHADKVVVHKKEHTLELFKNGSAFRKYTIALGTQPIGPKTQQGDHRTPEGTYTIDRRNPHSHFYRALHISYPNVYDNGRAQKLGASVGGNIMIHGLPNGFGWLGSAHRLKDWTDGCIAVTDQEMDQIWNLVPDGTSIEILP
jgi:murein L,D-transpeptidase YafK